MARYVIDAATLLQVLDRGVSIHAGHQLVAPNAIRSEALQLLLTDVIEGRRPEKEALAVHDRVTELKMRLLGDRVSRGTAWRIARQQGWETLRDAEYLAVAKLQADALITVDKALARAAKGVVPVAPLSSLSTAG